MKTLSALIFCVSVILLVYLSGASNKGDRYLVTLESVPIYASYECMDDCDEHVLITTIPVQQKVKVLARFAGQKKKVARVEYQGQTGWFESTNTNVEFFEVNQ